MARYLWIISFCVSISCYSQSPLPTPDHIVILIMENHSFNQIIGSTEAPTINNLRKSAYTALFTQSYGITYPSQPNYIILFSGCNQGITDSSPPTTFPFTAENLGRQLLDAGKTFISYAEDLPWVGYDGETSGKYVRRHNPAVYWIGNGKNQLPPAVVQPFSAFPEDFSLLPTVSFVIPNNDNNMHDKSIAQGDKWIETHLMEYIEWAKTHNSLFILTFDEDDQSQNNQITTLFTGQMVKPGNYSQKINHLNILRTIEEMYDLPYACDASKAEAIKNCWNNSDSISSDGNNHLVTVYADPIHNSLTVQPIKEIVEDNLKFILINVSGEKIKETTIQYPSTTIPVNQLSGGLYIYQVVSNNKLLQKGKIVIP